MEITVVPIFFKEIPENSAQNKIRADDAPQQWSKVEQNKFFETEKK